MKLKSPLQLFILLPFLLWGIACNGIAKKDKSKENPNSKVKNITNDPLLIDIRCIFQDKKGTIWLGTLSNGLYQYDGTTFHQFTVKDGLNSNSIYCVLEDKDGKLWIGTEEGLCLYNNQTFTQIKIPLPKNLPPNKNAYYQNHWVFNMMQTQNGQLWFATIDGVYIYDGKSQPTGEAGFTHFPLKEIANGFLNTNAKVERMLQDKAGNIWLGCRANEGVYRYDGKSITHFKLPQLLQGENGPRPKLQSWAWPQMQDANGNLWFSNWGGVYRYDGKSFTPYSAKDGLKVTMVSQMIEDNTGIFLLNGDDLFSYNGNTFGRLTMNNKQTYSGGWSMLKDRNGVIWVGTRENGLCVYNNNELITLSEYKQKLQTN